MSTSRRMLLVNNDDDNMKNIIIDITKFTKNQNTTYYKYYNAANTLAGFKNCGIFTSNAQLLEWLNEYINETGLLNYKVFVVNRESAPYSTPPSKFSRMKQVISVHYSVNTDGSTSTEKDFNITYTKYVTLYFHGTGSNDWGGITFYINGSNFVGMTFRGN